MEKNKAYLFEIFSSIQGEGLYIGDRQLFIRFAGCNLSCQYCDTKDALTIPAECRIEETPGEQDFKKIKNPLSQDQLLEIIERLTKNKNLHSAIVLTGGEPLLQIDFLLGFLQALKKNDFPPVYLETNGTLPKHMDEIINYVDIVSMDIQLPGITGQTSYFKENFEFMETVFSSGTTLFVKVLVDSTVTIKELAEVGELVAKISPDLPLVIQPLDSHKIKHDHLLSFQAVLKRKLTTVKILPQIHKILKML